MQVSVEKISSVECQLTITVPTEQVEKAYTLAINKIAKKANIKGFRPGKAPLSYIEQRFGNDARTEAVDEVIRATLAQALVEQALKPISVPQITLKKAAPDQPLEYVAVIEIAPEIGTINFTLEKIEKLAVQVTDADIERVIKQLQKQYTQWTRVDREAQETDRLIIDYKVVVTDQAADENTTDNENKVQNHPLELGSKTMIPGFEEGLLGAKAGEERKLSLQFPADYFVAHKAGKMADFIVTVKEVFTATVPPLDENFMQQMGIKNGKEDDLKQQIRQALESERDRLVQTKLKEQIFEQLLQQNSTIAAPKTLIANEEKKLHDEFYPKNQPHNHEQHTAAELARFNELATQRVKLGLLITEYVKQANIKADKNSVDKRIQAIAAVYENPQEVVAWLSSKKQREGIEGQEIEDLAIAKLLEGVPVDEKSISFAELKGLPVG